MKKQSSLNQNSHKLIIYFVPINKSLLAAGVSMMFLQPTVYYLLLISMGLMVFGTRTGA